MEFLTSILGAVMAKTGKLFCGCTYSRIKSTLRFKSNFSDVHKEMKKLIDLSDDIKHQLEVAERYGRTPTMEVKKWLGDVEKFVFKANSLQATVSSAADDQRLISCVCRCGQRIRLGKKVTKMLKEVERLLKASSFPDGMVTVSLLVQSVEYIPGPSIDFQTTASRNLTQLMKILVDDKFQRIGVWGMGGLGKTTLVKNLNNNLNNSSLNQPFSIVIWATVSKDLDLKRVQMQIAERLNLEVTMEESIQRTASRLYQRLEKETFLLILDDVWVSIDLDCLGIPQPSGSKILLTSRSSDVCREMMTEFEIKVNILDEEEAWQLFSQKAGEVVSLEHIEPFAEAVARECCGLPLALITVGTAMRRKTRIELWKHALKELRRSVPCIRGVRDKVYNPLKWSYDSLEGSKTKACFLFCALYPEDFSIEVSELVGCGLAEGLIDEQLYFEESVKINGIAVVESLKDSCLLEDGAHEGTMKMHDVVRDVAIWIASSMEDGCKSLVYAGIGLSEISEVKLSNSVKRISLANNKINKLPDCEMQCSNVSTLLLQGNLPLEQVPERFLQKFKALRVLNISGTRIQSLPPFLQLHELRALLLGDCIRLEVLPQLQALSRLQVLDLRATCIRELPKEMKNLVYLRQVNLSRTCYLIEIQAGIVSNGLV